MRGTGPRVGLRGAYVALVCGAWAALTGAGGCATPRSLGPDYPPDPPSCEKVVEQAVAEPGLPEITPPTFREPFVPPTAPAALRGRTLLVRFHVDAQGRVDEETVRVEGSTDAAYSRELADEIAEERFVPARLDNCRVPYNHTLNVRL